MENLRTLGLGASLISLILALSGMVTGCSSEEESTDETQEETTPAPVWTVEETIPNWDMQGCMDNGMGNYLPWSGYEGVASRITLPADPVTLKAVRVLMYELDQHTSTAATFHALSSAQETLPEDWRDQIQATVTFPVPINAVYEFQEVVFDEPLTIRGAPYLYLVAAREDQGNEMWAVLTCLMTDDMAQQAQQFQLEDGETEWELWDYSSEPSAPSLAAVLEYTTDVDPNASPGTDETDSENTDDTDSTESQDTEAEGLEVSVADITAEEDGELKVIIDAQLVDTDGSETVSVASVCGLPEQDCVGPFNLGSSSTLSFDRERNFKLLNQT